MIHEHGTYVITEIGPESGFYGDRDRLVGLVIHPTQKPRRYYGDGTGEWYSVYFTANKLSTQMQGLSSWWSRNRLSSAACICQCRLLAGDDVEEVCW